MEDNTIKTFLSDIELGKNHAIAVAKELLADGDGNKVTVNLQRTLVAPKRMESPPRDHVFFDVAGFVAYLSAKKGDSPLIMADVQNHTIEAVLDESRPSGLEAVSLRPTRHPQFKLLTNMLNTRMDITDFAVLAKRNREVLGETPKEGMDFAMLMQQITVSSTVKAYQGTGAKSTNGVVCKTEVKGSPGMSEEIDLPDRISARIPLYVKRPARTFDIELTVLASQQQALIIADAPQLELLMFQELEEMLAEIREAVGQDILTSVGCLKYSEWDYSK